MMIFYLLIPWMEYGNETLHQSKLGQAAPFNTEQATKLNLTF